MTQDAHQIMTDEGTLDFGQDGVVRVSGALTFKSCAGLFKAMQTHLDAGQAPLQIDLERVTAIDSAGLALLLEWQAASRESGTELAMTGAPVTLVQFAQLSEADDLLNLSAKDVT
jgi:ABC-type transporter Mla MlaB component